MKYMVGKFEDPDTKKPVRVFLHEAVWVLENKCLIPEGKLVAHEDGNPLNNEVSNLHLVDENKEYGDLHESKIFHENENNMEIIKGHFPDIYQKLNN
jgi:hypothetical protein